MKNIFKKIVSWVIVSSADAKRTSLTVNAFLLSLVPVVIIFSGLSNIDLKQEELEAFVNAIANGVELLLAFASSILFVFGLGRKIYLSAIGKNEALK